MIRVRVRFRVRVKVRVRVRVRVKVRVRVSQPRLLLADHVRHPLTHTRGATSTDPPPFRSSRAYVGLELGPPGDHPLAGVGAPSTHRRLGIGCAIFSGGARLVRLGVLGSD